MNPLHVLLAIILKNFKLILRSKTSTFIILVSPILIIAVVGAAFNTTGITNIGAGYYAPEKTGQIDDVLNLMNTNGFIIEKLDSKEECIDSVKSGLNHICMTFPPEFDMQDIRTLGKGSLEFYVDYSRMNLVWLLWDQIKSQVSKESTKISMGFAEVMFDKINETTTQLAATKKAMAKVSNDAKGINSKLNSFKTNLASMDLSFPVDTSSLTEVQNITSSSQADIAQFKSKVHSLSTQLNSQIAQLNSQIESAKQGYLAGKASMLASIDAFEAKLQEDKSALVAEKNKTQKSYDDCAAENPENPDEMCGSKLTPLQLINPLIDKLDEYLLAVNGSRQSLLNQSVSTNMTVNYTVDLSGIEKDLDAYSSKIQGINGDISSFSQGLGNAKKKINNLTAMRNSTLKDLEQISSLLSANMGKFDEMASFVDGVSSDLANMTFINAETLIRPIKTSMRSITSQKKFINYFLPSLLVLVVMFISVLLSSTLILSEKESKAFFRNFLAPVTDTLFIVAHYLSVLSVLMVQSVALLLMGHFFFGLSISRFGSLMAGFFLVNTTFILVGMFIGYLFRSEEGSTIASISASCLFLLFSSLAVPIETMSENIGKIANLNPFVLAEAILKKCLLFDKGIGYSVYQVVLLCVYTIALFVATVFLHHYSKNK